MELDEERAVRLDPLPRSRLPALEILELAKTGPLDGSQDETRFATATTDLDLGDSLRI